MLHVPYKGNSQALADLIGRAGRDDVRPGEAPSAPADKAGKVRALAVTSLARSPLLRRCPPSTVGPRGYEDITFNGLGAVVRSRPATLACEAPYPDAVAAGPGRTSRPLK